MIELQNLVVTTTSKKRVILSELENLCHLLEKLSAAPALTYFQDF